ncbi:MAG: sigma-54-dependent Fis family transcriptional regulator, partial [Bdellovibrionales bacterium]|nr:sigma-54-dependent Fis family transcriptional regulator [Bdellovibrionales bacterium]
MSVLIEQADFVRGIFVVPTGWGEVMSHAKNTASHLSCSVTPLVLVVDDEESICTTLSSVLRDEQFQTITAKDGTEALEKVREYQPDVVFLDIWMPGRDGIETLERIKEMSPETQVVMISGHATISTALEAMKLGALDFIEKPFDIESVIVAASRALERRRRGLAEARGEPAPHLTEPISRQGGGAAFEPTGTLYHHIGMRSTG